MVVCSLALTCYASEITITSVTFEKYTDQYGNENDANLVILVLILLVFEHLILLDKLKNKVLIILLLTKN